MGIARIPHRIALLAHGMPCSSYPSGRWPRNPHRQRRKKYPGPAVRLSAPYAWGSAISLRCHPTLHSLHEPTYMRSGTVAGQHLLNRLGPKAPFGYWPHMPRYFLKVLTCLFLGAEPSCPPGPPLRLFCVSLILWRGDDVRARTEMKFSRGHEDKDAPIGRISLSHDKKIQLARYRMS